MSYYRDLAFHLRRRFVDERSVGSVAQEVLDHVGASGEDPYEAFGSPADYAATFPMGQKTPLGRWLGYLSAIGALLLIAAGDVLSTKYGLALKWGPVSAVWPVSFTLITTGLVLGRIVDHRVPSAIARRLPRTSA